MSVPSCVAREVMLWRAVIGRAIKDAFGMCTSVEPQERKKIQEEAYCWFERSKDFELVCDFAHLNPTAVRDRVLRAHATNDLTVLTGLDN